jgi:hypothetical protein
VEFRPVKREVLNKLRSYAQDLEIVDFFERMSVLPSLRTYDKALAWKKSPHINFQQEILSECGVKPHVQALIEILPNNPQKAWIATYQQLTGRSRRDFFNQLPKAKELLGWT